MALKGHLISGGLVGPLAGIESGSANAIAGFDGSGNPVARSLSAQLDAVIGSSQGTIIKRGVSAWEKLDPADGYLKNTSGALSWASVSAPPVWEAVTGSPFTISGPVTVSGLAGYQAVRIILANLSVLNTGRIGLRVSTDNGSSFLNSSGDYYFVSGTTGSKTSATEFPFHSTAGVLTNVYGAATIEGFSLGAPKQINGSNALGYFVATTTALNAIQIFDTAGTLQSVGTVYVQGLPSS